MLREASYIRQKRLYIWIFVNNSMNVFLQKLWNNYNPGSGLEKPDFSSVLVQIDRFIGPVYGALLREDEFFSKWSSKENVWK